MPRLARRVQRVPLQACACRRSSSQRYPGARRKPRYAHFCFCLHIIWANPLLRARIRVRQRCLLCCPPIDRCAALGRLPSRRAKTPPEAKQGPPLSIDGEAPGTGDFRETATSWRRCWNDPNAIREGRASLPRACQPLQLDIIFHQEPGSGVAQLQHFVLREGQRQWMCLRILKVCSYTISLTRLAANVAAMPPKVPNSLILVSPPSPHWVLMVPRPSQRAFSFCHIRKNIYAIQTEKITRPRAVYF